MERWISWLCVASTLLLGCASPESTAESTESSLAGAPRLVHAGRLWASPAGGTDGVPIHTLAWEHADGSRTPTGVGPVTHAVLWQGSIVYVDPDRRLWQEGATQPFAEPVVDAPAVSPDGELLAYVVLGETPDGTHAEVHVRTTSGDRIVDRIVDRSLLSVGALRFSPASDTIFGVGSVNGGVAGLHMFDLGSGRSRCLTNCALRVGQPWGDAYLPPPGSASALRFEGDDVVFDAPAGVVRVSWRGGAR